MVKSTRGALSRFADRELLRQKGQFWTSEWVARAMVGYAVSGGSDQVFDPAVGAGAFFRAAKGMQAGLGHRLVLCGTEIDRQALREASASGLCGADLEKVEIVDFLQYEPPTKFKAIVANPPYIRHHRLGPEVKARLRHLAVRLLGCAIDGRAGLHVYFLLHALELLAPAGKLAFIVPADICEGVFAEQLWSWIARRFRLDAVVTFAPDASPFPSVDTNALILLITKTEPRESFFWARCLKAPTPQLEEWLRSGCAILPSGDLEVSHRNLSEALVTGLSRPASCDSRSAATLGDYARAVRGIATGCNEFFFLTRGRAKELALSPEFLRKTIGRTRDVKEDRIREETLDALDAAGRPTLLFSPDGRSKEQFPEAIRHYLAEGEADGVNKRTLIATRRPWYKMETRDPPPILFAYLGRRNCRFIRNLAGVVPLTGFLCLYPRRRDRAFLEGLWKVLTHPRTVANLACVGKSYGGGAIKVEPRALEKLPLPMEALAESGLSSGTKMCQMTLALQD